MKKIISLILCVCLLVSSIAVTSVAQEGNVTYTLKSEIVGSKLNVAIDLSDNTGIWGVIMALTFDQSVLKIDSSSITKGVVWTDSNSDSSFTVYDGGYTNYVGYLYIDCEYSSITESNTENGRVVTLSFDILDSNGAYDFALTAWQDDEFNHSKINDAGDDLEAVGFTFVCEPTVEGHAYGDWTVTADPNCTESGEKERACTICGATDVAVVPADGHKLVHHDAKAPECEEIGWDAYDTCENCDYTTYAEIPATGHKLVHYEAKAPECEAIGWDAYDVCENCDYTTYVEIPATGHTLVHHDAKAPECEAVGWDAYDTCENCDYTTYVEIPATGHKLVHYEAKAPSCNEIGWDAYDACENCDYSTYNELPTTAHTLVHHDAKAPECEAIGWDAYDVCENCDYTTYVEIPATGHTLVHHDAKAPACEAIGWDAYDTCENCDYTTYVEIPATGHKIVSYGAKAPECEAVGWEAYEACENCDYTTYVEIPATGHTLVHHDAKAPACEEIGWDAYDICENCDYTTYVEIPAVGHTVTDEWIIDIPAEGTNPGEKSQRCQVCGARVNVTVYYNAPFIVTVDGVSFEYAVGETVEIASSKFYKNEQTGKWNVFDKWTVDGVEIENAEVSTLTFVMPANNVTVTTVTFIHGDVDNNGKVNGQDTAKLKKAIKRGEYTKYADINCDGRLTVADKNNSVKISKGQFIYES